MHGIIQSHRTRLAAGLLILLGGASQGEAQRLPFIAVSGGATLPAGSGSDMMRTGWVAELMGGLVVHHGTVGLRAGASYGEGEVKPMSGDGDMGAVYASDGGRTRTIGLMAGAMYMPWTIAGVMPYVMAGVGVQRVRYETSATSFTWQTGGGAVVYTGRFGWYVEGRFMEARRDGLSGRMVPLTAGVRIGG